MKIVIVGGVAGGASAATRIRRMDEHAEIVIFEKGQYVSYANCGLPYRIGGVIGDDGLLAVNTPAELKNKFNLDVRTGHEVLSVNRGEKSVTVKNLEDGSVYTESYDKLLMSPGSVCVKPKIPGAGGAKVFYLRTIPDMRRLQAYIGEKRPKKAAIVGAGFIGFEVAENLMRLGIKPEIIEKAGHVFPALDDDVACDVQAYLRTLGVGLILNNGLTEIAENGEGVRLRLEDGETEADFVLMAVGMKPDNALAEGCGLAMTDRKVLIVDEYMRTSDENIYAVGDAVQVKNIVSGADDYVPLAGPANRQGRIAADNICGVGHTYSGAQGTAICKLFDMTVAWTGLSERKAKALGLRYDKAYLWSNDHASFYPNMRHISQKVVFEKPSGRILGAQLAGFSGVDKRCDTFAAAIRARMTGHDLAELELSYAPPYGSAKEPVNMAGFVIENVLAGNVRMVHWHDLERFIAEKSPQLVDVRPVNAFIDGHIDGSVSIPYEQFRKRFEKKLDRNRPVLLICSMGQNSYNCCRILAQHGYDCYSLAGGYRLYASAVLGTWNPESPPIS